MLPYPARQQPGQRRQYRPVRPRQARLADLPAQNRYLVAKNDEIGRRDVQTCRERGDIRLGGAGQDPGRDEVDVGFVGGAADQEVDRVTVAGRHRVDWVVRKRMRVQYQGERRRVGGWPAGEPEVRPCDVPGRLDQTFIGDLGQGRGVRGHVQMPGDGLGDAPGQFGRHRVLGVAASADSTIEQPACGR